MVYSLSFELTILCLYNLLYSPRVMSKVFPITGDGCISFPQHLDGFLEVVRLFVVCGLWFMVRGGG